MFFQVVLRNFFGDFFMNFPRIFRDTQLILNIVFGTNLTKLEKLNTVVMDFLSFLPFFNSLCTERASVESITETIEKVALF